MPATHGHLEVENPNVKSRVPSETKPRWFFEQCLKKKPLELDNIGIEVVGQERQDVSLELFRKVFFSCAWPLQWALPWFGWCLQDGPTVSLQMEV